MTRTRRGIANVYYALKYSLTVLILGLIVVSALR